MKRYIHSTFATAIKKLLLAAGLKVSRIDTPMRTLEYGLVQLSKQVKLKSIVDIGVANGTPELYAAFPRGYRYLLVDADPAHRKKVAALAQELNADVAEVFCAASSGQIALKATTNHELSSAYNLKHGAQVEQTFMVPTEPLDKLVTNLPPPYLIKIDVEGAELEVLKGSIQTLEHTCAVVVETSVAKKYEGGAEFSDIVCFMKAHGFAVFDILSGCNRNGRLYQVDLVFVKSNSPLRDVHNYTS